MSIPSAEVHPCCHSKRAKWTRLSRDIERDYPEILNLAQRHTRCTAGSCLRKPKDDEQPKCRFEFPMDLVDESALTEVEGKWIFTPRRNDFEHVHLLGCWHAPAASRTRYSCLYAFVRKSGARNFVRRVLIWWVSSLLLLSTSQRQLSDQQWFRNILDRISLNRVIGNYHVMLMTTRAALIPNFEVFARMSRVCFLPLEKWTNTTFCDWSLWMFPSQKSKQARIATRHQPRRLKQHNVWIQSHDCLLERGLCWELIFERRSELLVVRRFRWRIFYTAKGINLQQTYMSLFRLSLRIIVDHFCHTLIFSP